MKITSLEEVGPRKTHHPAPCPWCQCGILELIHSATGDAGFRRRLYECKACDQRTITQERVVGKTEKRYVASTYRAK